MISSLPLHSWLHSVFGRHAGIIPCSECYWEPADWKCTAIHKFQICFPLCFWGIFQREDRVILGTPLYCLHFSSWLLNCMADLLGEDNAVCICLCWIQEASLKSLFLIPLSTQVCFHVSDLCDRAACLLLVDTEPGVIIVQPKCKHFSNHIAWLIITPKGREAWKLGWLLFFVAMSS